MYPIELAGGTRTRTWGAVIIGKHLPDIAVIEWRVIPPTVEREDFMSAQRDLSVNYSGRRVARGEWGNLLVAVNVPSDGTASKLVIKTRKESNNNWAVNIIEIRAQPTVGVSGDLAELNTGAENYSRKREECREADELHVGQC